MQTWVRFDTGGGEEPRCWSEEGRYMCERIFRLLRIFFYVRYVSSDFYVFFFIFDSSFYSVSSDFLRNLKTPIINWHTHTWLY